MGAFSGKSQGSAKELRTKAGENAAASRSHDSMRKRLAWGGMYVRPHHLAVPPEISHAQAAAR
jgi:hypothetical protein